MKTAILMGTLTALLMLAAGALGLYIGGDPMPYLTFAFVMAMVINLVSYFKSDSIVLRMYKAREVGEDEYPELHRMVRELTQTADMPMPKIAIVPSNNPNAFATGRNKENAVVAVTEGALNILDSDELRAVISHELGHILNRDMFISTMAAVIASIIGYLGQMGWWMSWGRRSDNNNNSSGAIGMILLIVFIPLASMIIRMAISRDREYGADRRGAEISGQPDMLANALVKLENASMRSPMRGGNQATSSLFIVNPFRAQSLMTLLSTHPPTIKRVEKLNEMAIDMGRPTVYVPQYN
ncbi:MAG TPA: zinc metalloprotease HtpX [Candidatus Methanofastidiosa archaeon]|nr:zinc metalloprotease HtpX [Candidatus Methanofastidiosa archaeon]